MLMCWLKERSIGKRFLFENLTDVTIADDKLRHTSNTFSDHVLQRTGFRGSRCGPVMIGAGSVQHGLIMVIYISRKGDSAQSATDGAVYNAMATMEFKHKSVLRNIPSNIVCKVGNAHSTSWWRNGKCQRCNVTPATQDQEAKIT
jgi:hypothetical protein